MEVQTLKNQPKEIMMKIAMDMDYDDILSLCNSHPRINKFLCKNDQLWKNKFKKEFKRQLRYVEAYKIVKDNENMKNISPSIKNGLDAEYNFERLKYSAQKELYHLIFSIVDLSINQSVNNILNINENDITELNIDLNDRGYAPYSDINGDQFVLELYQVYIKEYNEKNNTNYVLDV